ncbi:hypothetical protein CDO87_06280 [Sagittula sp. P11]|uniref:DUF2125 domain-containing protein n=1 Tax=Sagittula sp. P11 TaxID=2009329 RepID=UPI000C2D1F64|nr:DUF2125 domain-containing protein [Sagittula sp. P11]AUC52823.1 hypothetical protein CDO87_06280 [Sagittula sp. P11]
MKRFATASALALVLSGPAYADITPQQAWDSLESYMSGFGYEVSATETVSGDTLTVTDITMTVPVPEEDASVGVTMPDMTYTAKGDGSVDLSMPESSQIVITFSEDGEPSEGSVTLGMTQSGMVMNISGDENDLHYEYSAESMTVTLDEIESPEEQLPPDVLKASVSMGPMEGSADVSKGADTQTITQEVTYGDISYDFAFKDPENPASSGILKGTLRGLAAAGETTVPLNSDYEDPAAMFAAGFAVDATMAHKGGTTEFNFVDGSDTVSGTLSSESGELGMAMSEASMTYALSAVGQTVSMTVPDMPFPIDARFGEAGFSLEVPLAKSDTPKPAGLSILLADFTMADMLWNIFDPGQTLPRDPATIGANVEAEVTPFVSLLEPDAIEEVESQGGVPGELNALTLSDLVVRAVGAEVLGEGSFTFDNTDLETFDGMPRPEGQVNLQVSGLNGLIDKLIAMGIVQEQDAMGARMMLGMFTVPGAEPDTATSTIEFNAQGQILANGQRIK